MQRRAIGIEGRVTDRRPLRLISTIWAGLWCVITTCASTHAEAFELRHDAQRIEQAWVSTSSAVTRLRPLFLASAEAMPIVVPYTRDVGGTGCTSVGVLGTRTTDFMLEVTPQPSGLAKGGDQPEQVGQQSNAGSAMLTRCGPARSELRNLVVRMKSPQAALEILVAQGASPAPSFDRLLPERAAGTIARTGRPGLPPPVAPLSQRVEAATREIVEARGRIASSKTLRADRQGELNQRLHLSPGCHRFVAMPTIRIGGRVGVSDTDMEVRNAATDAVLLRDRSFATDALIDMCVGSPEMVDVVVGGVPPGGTVTLVQGYWLIPLGIPGRWEPRARAAIGHALLHRRSPAIEVPPTWEALGVNGTTVVALPVEPGACYVVAAGAAAGDVGALQVAANVGPRLAADNGGGGVEAGLVSFCSGGESVARLQINAIGSQITWVAGAWTVARAPLGAEVLP